MTTTNFDIGACREAVDVANKEFADACQSSDQYRINRAIDALERAQEDLWEAEDMLVSEPPIDIDVWAILQEAVECAAADTETFNRDKALIESLVQPLLTETRTTP